MSVRVIVMANIEDKVIGYNGNSLLAEWWYWTDKIIEHQSMLKKTNDKHTSKKLNKLYRKRKLRFRHAVKTIVSSFVHTCWLDGVSEIVIGEDDIKTFIGVSVVIKDVNQLFFRF